MRKESERLVKLLEKVLTNITTIVCDTDVPYEERTELYNKQKEILQRFNIFEE